MKKNTKIWNINIEDPSWEQELSAAAAALQQGKQIAFPTETVYGLGGDATNTAAVAGIFEAKGRPSDNPLIVHISNRSQLEQLVDEYETIAELLMEKFWPGPLTIIFPVKQNVLSPLVTAGLDTVGIRMPDHQLALSLIERAGCPVAAPSANRSGRPSPTRASHVYEDLAERIEGIVDGGPTGVGLESTVIEIPAMNHIHILRPGGVTLEQLEQAVPHAIVTTESMQESKAAPRSPGMKYTHYAPKGKLIVVQGEEQAVRAYIQQQLDQFQDHRCGVLAFDEHIEHYQAAQLVLSLGSIHHLEEAAVRLYELLRQFDEHHITHIWSEASASTGIGAALMNRLYKAAGHETIDL